MRKSWKKKKKKWFFDEKKSEKVEKKGWGFQGGKFWEKKVKNENRSKKFCKIYAPFNSKLIQEIYSKNISAQPWTLHATLVSADGSITPLPYLVPVSLS